MKALRLPAGLTLAFLIGGGAEVVANTEPTFGSWIISDQRYVLNAPIRTWILPQATSGDGTLSYSLDGTLPAGLTFDFETRRLTGTPAATQSATVYTYTATDVDGDSVSLTFTISVEARSVPGLTVTPVGSATDKLDVSWSGLTDVDFDLYVIRWKTGGQMYSDNRQIVVLRRVTNVQITGLAAGTGYGVKVLARDLINGFVAASEAGATTTADAAPTFGSDTISNRTYWQNIPIEPLTLPQATGGDGALSHALDGTLPAGLAFDAASRRITGTPSEAEAATTHTWTATDADGDFVTLTFTIVVAVNWAPVFEESSYTFDLAENEAGTTTLRWLGKVSATDANAGDSVRYAVVAGHRNDVAPPCVHGTCSA